MGPTHLLSHSFRSLPFISSFTSSYLLGTLQSPVFKELILWEEGETQSSKHDKAPQGADGRTQHNVGSVFRLCFGAEQH